MDNYNDGSRVIDSNFDGVLPLFKPILFFCLLLLLLTIVSRGNDMFFTNLPVLCMKHSFDYFSMAFAA